jgi:hypothetical protein
LTQHISKCSTSSPAATDVSSSSGPGNSCIAVLALHFFPLEELHLSLSRTRGAACSGVTLRQRPLLERAR